MDEQIFIITDGCVWEQNKQNKTFYPHGMEVVDIETGQVRYIRSGSKIKFIDGHITESRDQETYNKEIAPLSSNTKNKSRRKTSKTKSKSK